MCLVEVIGRHMYNLNITTKKITGVTRLFISNYEQSVTMYPHYIEFNCGSDSISTYLALPDLILLNKLDTLLLGVQL